MEKKIFRTVQVKMKRKRFLNPSTESRLQAKG